MSGGGLAVVVVRLQWGRRVYYPAQAPLNRVLLYLCSFGLITLGTLLILLHLFSATDGRVAYPSLALPPSPPPPLYHCDGLRGLCLGIAMVSFGMAAHKLYI